MKTPVEEKVLAANASFYEFFAQRDLAGMERLWAARAPVSCMHPGWELLRGREAVLDSWHAILTAEDAPPIRFARANAHFLSQEVALVFCDEFLPAGRLLVTNTFVLEDGEWKLVHHQASQTRPETAPPSPRDVN